MDEEMKIVAQEPPGDVIHGSVRFFTNSSNEVMRICPNGDVLVYGELVANDPTLANDFKSILAHGKPTRDPPSNQGGTAFLSFASATEEVVRFHVDGAFVRGQKVTDNQLIYHAFREWVRNALKGVEEHGGN